MVCKLAIASMSLGRAWAHSIPSKFTAAAAAGIPGIEIFYEDLLYQAQALPGGATPSNLILASHQIRSICDSLSLQIMGIGPFYGYEGILDSTIRAEKLQELKLWFRMARILGTDVIQIPSTFMTAGVTGSKEHIVQDFKEVAEMGMQENPPIRFAYENLCFGTFNDTWSKAWSIVEAVDYPNFGMCLDTFNIAGREYADPSSPTGTVPNASVVFAASLKKMAQTIDLKKVFYIQIVDAERLASPLVKGHDFYVEGQKARMSWSRNCRLFMCEEDRGGYLPVMDVLRAICDGIGYEGWISIELFNRSLVEEGEEVPKEHAARAVQSWEKVVKAMGWEGKTEEIRATAQVAGAAFGTRREVERKAEETFARL